MNQVIAVGDHHNISASALIQAGAGAILGIFVASASNVPTIKVWDSASASGTVLVNTFTPAAATYYQIPAFTKTGIYVTISGTVDCTVIVGRGQ